MGVFIKYVKDVYLINNIFFVTEKLPAFIV